MKQSKSKYPWLLLNRGNRVCIDNERNKYDLAVGNGDSNIDLLTDSMFKNNLDILQKMELRRNLLEKSDLDSNAIAKLIKSRRPKAHDEVIRNIVPEKYWRFWNIKK